MEIKFSDWQNLDLKVGTVLEVKQHPNADKLYVLKVDIGKEINLVAGIKEHYSEQDLVGKQIVVFTNLEKKPLRGVISEGMLLAVDDDNEVALLIPDKKVKNGAKIR